MHDAPLCESDIIKTIEEGVRKAEKVTVWDELKRSFLDSVETEFRDTYLKQVRKVIERVKRATGWDAFVDLCPSYHTPQDLKKSVMERVEANILREARKRKKRFKKQFKEFLENFIKNI